VLSDRLRKTLSGSDTRMIELADRCRLSNIRSRVQPILESFRNLPAQA